MSNIESSVAIKPNIALQEPPLFKIIYLNDNQTTMEFVIESLISYFEYSTETAMLITQDIHEKGSAVVAILPFEIAEQKGIEITLEARTKNFPLQVKIEPDS